MVADLLSPIGDCIESHWETVTSLDLAGGVCVAQDALGQLRRPRVGQGLG